MRGSTLVLCGAVLVSACSIGDDRGQESTAGMGVPQQSAGEEFPGERQRVRTRIHLAPNGCFLGSLLERGKSSRYLVVWPTGTELGTSGDALRLPDGEAVRDRDVLVGDGVLMATPRLPGFGADGYWDNAVGFCTPEASDVLVLDAVTKD